MKQINNFNSNEPNGLTSNSDMQKIGDIIKRKRQEREISMEKLAHQADVCYKSVLNIEHGGETTTKILSAICNILGLEISIKDKEE